MQRPSSTQTGSPNPATSKKPALPRRPVEPKESPLVRKLRKFGLQLGLTKAEFDRSIKSFVEGLEENARNNEIKDVSEILEGDIPYFYFKEFYDTGITFGIPYEEDEREEEEVGPIRLARADRLLGAIAYGINEYYFD